MFTRLVESLAATEALSEVFGDQSVLQAMLDFEGALARVEERRGMIPPEAGAIITEACRAAHFDISTMTRLSLRAGTPAIPLVKLLTARVREKDAKAAGFVHWGATSQDVVDTAMVLLLKRCRGILVRDHERILEALFGLSEMYAGSVMQARTLLQPAPPITFGLKAAQWHAGLRRSWERVSAAFDAALCLQFGGASGTLAALGDRGPEVSAALAADLGLALPEAPWHTQRDRPAALLSALSLHTATLGKIALDIALLMQHEIAEVSEPVTEGRGGSSAMPQKRNPTACMLTLAAAKRVPGLLADFVNCMVQEHERAAGGWQAEWSLIMGIVQSAGVALESMGEVTGGLQVDPARMRANLERTGSAVFAEKAVVILAGELGPEAARSKVESTIRETGRPPDLPGLDVPEDYLGSAEKFRQNLLKGNRNDGVR